MKVLVATDGSVHSMKAVARALELAEQGGAEITLISVAYFAQNLDEMPINIQEKLEAEARAALAKSKAVFDAKNIKVDTMLQVGEVPANNIIQVAEEGKFDQILIGSTGLTGFKKLLMGSTAGKVVANAPCTVTIIR
jgi:nucleotide-binding universal stress UspA family protein